MKDRVVHALVRLYPRAWRERYEEEFLALLADREPSWRDVPDISGAVAREWSRTVLTPRTELAALQRSSLGRLVASLIGAVAIDRAAALVAGVLQGRGWQAPFAESLLFAIQTAATLRCLLAQRSFTGGVSRLELSAWVMCLCAMAPLAHLEVDRYVWVWEGHLWIHRVITLAPLVSTLLFLSGSTRAAIARNQRAQQLWRNRWRHVSPSPLGLR